MGDLKQQILDSLDDILDEVVAVVQRDNEDEIMGRLGRLAKTIESDEIGEAATELSLLVRALLLVNSNKE